MRKIFFLTVFALLGTLALTGAGCGKKQAEQPKGEQQSQENFSGTLSDLFKRGKSVHCTYTMQADKMQTQGDVYVGAGKMRTDISVNVEGMAEQKTHALMMGDEQYVWVEGQPQGMKVVMSIEEQQKLAEQAKQAQGEVKNNAPDWGEKVDYKCVNWNADDGLFKVPESIKFTDYTAMMRNLPKLQGAGSGAKVDVCAMCDTLPASVKDACRKSNCK